MLATPIYLEHTMRNLVAAPTLRALLVVVGLTVAAVVLLFISTSASSAADAQVPAPATVGQQGQSGQTPNQQHNHAGEKLRVPWNSWLISDSSTPGQ